MNETTEPTGPRLPPGRLVDLPGRGRTFVREAGRRSGAPTLLLLHGWTATADLNFYSCFAPLAERFHVVALDHRGHGRGIRSARPFRLEDCADDAVALADVLDIERFVPVGYSMGGPIAQLVWRRHRPRVTGLVLCATARRFSSSQAERALLGWLGTMGTVSRIAPTAARDAAARQWLRRRSDRGHSAWAVDQVSRHDWSAVLQAAGALSRFDAGPWIGDIDVPTAVVVTIADRLVPPPRQQQLYESIPHAMLFEVEGDHDVVVAAPERFVPVVGTACARVIEWAGCSRPTAFSI